MYEIYIEGEASIREIDVPVHGLETMTDEEYAWAKLQGRPAGFIYEGGMVRRIKIPGYNYGN